MKLITYRDGGTLRTLMVDEFRDSYNTSDGWENVYAVGEERIVIPRDDCLTAHELHDPWKRSS